MPHSGTFDRDAAQAARQRSLKTLQHAEDQHDIQITLAREWTVTNSADLCDSFVVTYNMSSTEAPAGYEQKVKRAGQYKDSPPPAPKGWTYVAGVRTKSCLPQRRGPTARGLRVSATRDSNQSRFLQDNFTGDGLLAAVCCCIPGTLSVSPHTRNFAVARRSLV
jgi:hypothetical protein